ncbi:MAG: hypothetical protein HRT38_11095 [Alteromonadaceae bacterium]|nr:hypothetical protein [Alteromonadaceae bacterium]
MNGNPDITDDFLDEKWRELEGKAETTTKEIIAVEFNNLKAELAQISTKFENGNYGQALQTSLDELKSESAEQLKTLSQQQQKTRLFINELQVKIDNIDDENLKMAFTNLKNSVSQTDEKLNNISTSVLNFSDKAGKVITNTLMKSVIGVVP